MENKTIRAVGYARVSTKMQLEGKDFDSIDAQKALIMWYAKTHPGIELVEIFTDPGKSGKNMARPGMQALMKRLKNRDIGCVLAYKLDRISRNNLDYAEFEKAMAELGVSVIYTNDSNPDGSPTGHLMRSMMAGFAQLEREQISQRVKDKRLELIKQGYHAGGHPPFGYICGDKKCTIAPDPGSAGQIREIFTLALGGKKPSEIAAHMLKKYGVLPTNHTRNGKPYGGRPYCENIVAKILANPTYAGFVYREKGAELYKGLHEPLVNPEDWKTIQRALKSKKHRRQIRLKANSTHILKGKLFCECGAAMTCGSSGKRTKNNGIFYYYLCSAKNREHSARQCKTSISKDILEAVVFSAIGYAATKGIPLGEIRESYKKYEQDLLAERKALARERNQKEAELRKAVKRFGEVAGNKILSEALEAELRNKSLGIEKIDARLSEIERETELFSHDTDLGDLQTKAALEDMDSVQCELTFEEKKALIASAVEKLTLRAEKTGKYRKNFKLEIVPTKECMEKFGVMNVEFEVDILKGRSDWKITSPFEISSKNYGENHKPAGYKKRKRHWLLKVAKWQKAAERGDTLAEISQKANASVPMVSRKLAILNSLDHSIVAKILGSRLTEDNQKLTFRALERLSRLPKARQLAGFAELLD